MCILALIVLITIVGYACLSIGWHFGRKDGRRTILRQLGKRRERS